MLLLTLDFVGQDIDAVSNLTLVGVNGTDLETFNITQGEGFYQDSYYVAFIPSPDRFRLKVTGFDTSGARFQRVKPTLFTLGDVKLSQNVDNRNNSNAIFPGETLELEIKVENSGDRQTLYFKASDDLNYCRSINSDRSTLGKNDTITLRVTLFAPSHATYGVTSTVTVFASQNSDHTQVVNFMVLFVTVASKVSYYTALARTQRERFPQAKLRSKINARFLLNEHGHPHFLMHEFKLHEVIYNIFRVEEKFKMLLKNTFILRL